MESPPRQLHSHLRQHAGVPSDSESSTVKAFDQLSPSRSESTTPTTNRLSPHIQGILNRGLAEDLSRLLAKTKDPFQDSKSGYFDNLVNECSAHGEASSPIHVDDADMSRVHAAAAVEVSVAESATDLQERVFEWEDLYFDESDVVPECDSHNLYIWALRGRRPVPMSNKSIEFGFGRVYIILHIKSFVPSPIMTCFYWTGHKAHFSSVACAAVHAIQLSRRIGCLKTSRQMEGVETADFFDAIGKFSVVPSTSEPSLQKHIPALHTSFAVLCNLQGYAHVEHRLMPAKSMIAQRDVSHCVVVDCGKHVYMFPPSHPNSPSVYHAMRLVQCMKEDRIGRVSVSIVDDGSQQAFDSIRKHFWSSCDTVESENSILDVHDTTVFDTGEEDDDLEVIDITTGVMCKHSFELKSSSCYVLKCFGFALCVIGSESTYSCRESAKERANDLVSANKCINMSILYGSHSVHHPLVQACLPAQLLVPPPDVSLSRSYRTKMMCRVSKNISSTIVPSSPKSASGSSPHTILDELFKYSSSSINQTSPTAMRSSPGLHIAAFEEVFASTIANIWVFDGHSTRTLSTSEYGVFEVHHLYIIQAIRSSAAKGGVHIHRLYFWIGPQLHHRAAAMAKIISISNSVSHHIRKGGNNCSEVEIIVFENFVLNSNMCHKPACLTAGSAVNHEFQRLSFANHDAVLEFSAFFKKGIFVANKVFHPTHGLSVPSVALGCISGRSVSSSICTLMKREVKSLHSLGNFCIMAPTCVLLWYGRWSDSVSRRVALDFVRYHFKNRLYRTFDEGCEPLEFFSYLEQSRGEDVSSDNAQACARAPEYLLTVPWWIPRLFECGMETGSLVVKPCPSVDQHFFRSSSCFIIDVWTCVFVWVGSSASATLASESTLLAERFATGCPDRSICRLALEHQHSESQGFRDLFIIWRDWPRLHFESEKYFHVCNSGELERLLNECKLHLNHRITKEFDLTMIEWDQETLDRWKNFARAGKVIPAEATVYPVASPPLVVSPSRNRPAFRGARARVVAQGSNH